MVLGGFAFNIGNIAGCGLGVNVLTGLSFQQGAIISGIIALILFWAKEIGRMLDGFTKILGTVKILLTLFIAVKAHPPLLKALEHTFAPEKISPVAIVTIVGGTVGGYLTFSGAHRLIDAGMKGKENLTQVNKSALSGIIISTVMRFILFLAVVGIVSKGIILDKDNPASTVFHAAAGNIGLRIFGIVLWSASVSSVVGSSYTSVSFFKTFHPALARHERMYISVFIILTTFIFVLIGKPAELLLLVGAINGLILPVALSIILIAATKKNLMNGYKHPVWMQTAGWIVVIFMGWMGAVTIQESFSKLF